MKTYCCIALFVCISTVTNATVKDSTIIYTLPDSVKAIQFMAEIRVNTINSKKEMFAGIKTDAVKLSLESDKKKREILFKFPESAMVMASGLQTDASEKGEIEFDYNWEVNETYKLMISVATDSAENFSLYAGYAWLPKENKWKFIGACKILGRWTAIQSPATYYTPGKKLTMQPSIGQVWCQRQNGSWKNMKDGNQPGPIINLFSHTDSVLQRQADLKLIQDAIASGKTDTKENIQGVYYTIMKAGTGRQVSVTDTVVAYYKGYLLNDGLVFDQTKDKPATFPLSRLIKGWQVGVPLCKVGGKIKLVIPSDLAYSIRTRAAKIPPNSILVFEIEVVEVKQP